MKRHTKDQDGPTPAPEPFDVALVEHFSGTRDPRRYRKLVELGVKSGDPLAEYAMATWYLLGDAELKIRRDPRRAVRLLSRAARSFNRAMYDLGVCKLRGEGTRKDARAAYALFQRSADAGSVAGLRGQAYCLRNGIGVRPNVALARKLELRAQRFQDMTATLSADH